MTDLTPPPFGLPAFDVDVDRVLRKIGYRPSKPAGSGRREPCIIPTFELRTAVCGRPDPHEAVAFVRLSCGCDFTYCAKSLVAIYGPTALREVECPKHSKQLQRVAFADWIV